MKMNRSISIDALLLVVLVLVLSIICTHAYAWCHIVVDHRCRSGRISSTATTSTSLTKTTTTTIGSKRKNNRWKQTFFRVPLEALSDRFLEDDIIAVQRPSSSSSTSVPPRLCAVQADGKVAPLCLKEGDVETDLYADPRVLFASSSDNDNTYWSHHKVRDEDVVKVYQEQGYYGQRPVPSLGGGPGYGADAEEVWSVSEALLDEVRRDGVDLPVLNVGIAHGEKARGGSLS